MPSITKPSTRNGTLESVLWKRFVLVFLAVFSDETADVEESRATAIFCVVPGSLPQEPDRQTADHTEDDQARDDESRDVKAGLRTVSISRKDVNGLRGH